MLVKFRVKNFRSFKELNEFSMVKGKQRYYEERIASFDDAKILKFSALFGANASGKSNLIRAIKVMQFIVLNNRVPVDAFQEYYKLDPECAKKPTYFEIVFTLKNEFFSYGFEIFLDNGRIQSEWLYKLHRLSNGRINEKKIFDYRNRDITFGKFKINPRVSMYAEDVKIRQTLLFLNHVSRNRLMFANSRSDVVDILTNVYSWFQSSLKVVYTGEALYSPELTSNINVDKISHLLSYFDTGVKSVSLDDCSQADFLKDMGPFGIDLNSLHNALDNRLKKKGEKPSIILRTANDIWVIESVDGELQFKRLCFYHDEQQKIRFRVSNESDGTLRLFELAEALINESNERVVIVDELDRCLHPVLTIQYVRLFLKKVFNNNNNSQLIVTTHESRLMDLDILRRDEIWFVKKENDQSKLYSLEEFNVRFDQIVDKAYLEGRYGGVPIFDSIFFPETIKHENKK